MRICDIRIGMLVNRVYQGQPIGDNPLTVVGFNGDKVVMTCTDGQTISNYADHLEPAHDGCGNCKHTIKGKHKFPCLYCRCNADPGTPQYSTLPDLWEEASMKRDDKAKDIVQISRKDAEDAAKAVSLVACIVENMGWDAHGAEEAMKWHELAKRLMRK